MITKIHIENYKVFEEFTLEFNENLNIIVGDNETGKSTILKAINLALTKRLNGRQIEFELAPYLFNQNAEQKYIKSIQEDTPIEPPKIIIELYLRDKPEFYHLLKGTNNTAKEDVCGIKLEIVFDDIHTSDYKNLINEKSNVKSIPSEYYKVKWYSFAFKPLTAKNIPIKAGYTDATTIRLLSGTDFYLQDIIKNNLDTRERVGLNVSYRKLKEAFSNHTPIKDLNAKGMKLMKH